MNRHHPAPYRVRPKILTLLLNLLVLSGLVLSGACRPAQVPTAPTPGPTALPPTPSLAANDTGLPAVDNGAPLPPQLVELQPRGGQELPLDGEIVLTFDQAMDSAATAAAWKMSAADGSAIPGQVSWPDQRSLRFKPAQELQREAYYRGTLDTSAKSAQGVPLSDPLELAFNTVTTLQVSQVFPADGTSNVAGDAVITAIFNRPVVPLVVNEERDKLPNPLVITPSVAGHGEWVSTSVYAFRPDKPLKGAVEYTVTIPAGLSDAAQETQLAEDYTWRFTTATPSILSFQLSDGSVNPEDNRVNVLLDEYFTINFNQPMNVASTEAALSLKSKSGESIALTSDWQKDNITVVVTPTQRLALGTTYTLNLDKSAQAEDGGALAAGLTWTFTTVLPPAVEYISPPDPGPQGEGYSGNLIIKFASPMRFDTVKDKIVVTPAPPNDIQWWYNQYDWSVSAFFLLPSTHYEVRLTPGATDIYGNPITEEKVVSFTTQPAPPQAGLQMPYEPSVMRVDGPQEFYVSYRNVSRLNLKLYALTPAQFTSFLSGTSNQYEYVPSSSTLVWQKDLHPSAKQNKLVVEPLTPSGAGGAPLSAGFYFLTLNSPDVPSSNHFLDNRLLIVADSNLTFKSATNDALMWLTDLQSGLPKSGVPLTVYDKNFQPIGQGTTDSDGLLKLAVPAPEQPYDPRFVLTGAPGSDPTAAGTLAFASSQWGSGMNLYDYGLWSAYYAPANQPKTYFYTDRPLYRPGQPVYFKGIVRLDDDLDYQLPKQAKVHIKIDNYKETVYEGDLPLSPYGTFDGQLTLDPLAALGWYSITAAWPDDLSTSIGGVGFSVAEYRKPEFQVTVTAEPKDVLAGDNYTATIRADYYSGGAVAGAQVDWTVVASPFFFTPPAEYSEYAFNDYEGDAGTQQPSPQQSTNTETIATGKGVTGADGVLAVTLPADLSASKTSRQFTFEATVTDISTNSVSGRAVVTGHRSQVYPGIKPKTYVGTTGQEQAFDLVALDWDGNPLPGQKVSVDIFERRWYSVQQQDATGRVEWTSTVEDIPVTSFTDLALDAQGKGSVKFTPDKGGIYRARVTALDAQGNPGVSAAYLWVAGTDFIPWRQTNDRSFDLVADRKTYAPGDTAEILIASPFEGDSYALVTVERGHVRHEEVLHLTNNSTIYKLPITPDYAPNVYVSVLVVKGVDDANPRPNFKMGMVELKVDPSAQTLVVNLSPDKQQAGPGDQVTYTVTTQDAKGNPVDAELSLGLSDVATLSLADPNSPPILDYFYDHRTLSVWTTVPINMDLEDYNATISEQVAQGPGMGSGGGGKGEGEFGVFAVRQNFPDTPYWEAHLQTGSQGKAEVTVTLPDNLTTWRMDARAVTQDTRVGQTTNEIISTKPLLVSPQTPRFFVVGDQARLGAAVHNNTDQPLRVNVSLNGSGLTLLTDVSQVVEVAANSQAYVTWEAMVDPQSTRVDLVFSAASESGGYTDASRPTQGTLDNQGLPVYRYEAHETVGTSGQMTAGGSQVEAISLPTTLTTTEGTLDIQVSPSLAAGMTDGLTYLEHYPYECVEQTISRFLPNVITTRALQSAGLSDPTLEANLQEQVNQALQRLYNWQNADGGWSWWATSAGDETVKSDILASAYVVLGLVEAKDAGYGVDADVLERGLNYLRGVVQPVNSLKDPSFLNRQAFVLYVLARAGQPNVSSGVQLYDQRNNMALYARAFLAQTFYLVDPQDPRLKTLLSDFNTAAITSASGTHWEEKQPDPQNWNTDTRTTAIVLSALSQLDPLNPLNANAVRWLMSNRTNGHWQGTQETAWTLMALTDWMVASGELKGNYQYAVSLNGQRLGGSSVNASADPASLRQNLSLSVKVADLLKDQANRLVFARDSGPGNLYYTAFLDVMLPVESIQPLDQGITVSRSYYKPDDPFTPVTQAQQGDLLLARLTVVAPAALHYTLVDDPLPAGLEAVDQSLKTSTQNMTLPEQYNWQDVESRGWGWWYFDNTQLRDEKVVLSASYLPAGTYVYTYLVRASTPGTFRTIPPTAQEFYFPDVYGRGAGTLFTVNP